MLMLHEGGCRQRRYGGGVGDLGGGGTQRCLLVVGAGVRHVGPRFDALARPATKACRRRRSR
jgi:hypothetical protein